MHWIYMLSSDTKWDDLYMFKLEVSALSEGPMVTWRSPFLEIFIEKMFCEVQIWICFAYLLY